jgi:uncharacterized membrane protein
MQYLVLGLVLFLGVHSLRIVADDWRFRTLARLGEAKFKGIYSLISLAGFALVIWGFGQARQTPVILWIAPVGLRHALSLVNLVAFVFLVAAYVPRNGLKARLHHPMVLGVMAWSVAHLAVNGFLAHVVLFGSFAAWSIASYVAAVQRDRVQGTVYAAGNTTSTIVTLVGGVVAWAVFAFLLHGMLIGTRPFG